MRTSPDLQQCLDAMTAFSLLPEHVRDGRGSLGEYRGISAVEGLGARPSIEIASPLSQRDPQVRTDPQVCTDPQVHLDAYLFG